MFEKMRELGGEFWLPETHEIETHWWDIIGYDQLYYVSGRAALDAILCDIKLILNSECLCAYLPSYFCDSMITPFLKNGINVKFYSITFRNGNLIIDYKEDHECDIVYLMEYFGYHDTRVHDLLKLESKKKVIIIQDSTHSLLQESPYLEISDYIFASFRKWTAIPGAGIAIKMKAPFVSKTNDLPIHKDYVKLREKAMRLKAAFMTGETVEKGLFLDIFNKADTLLNKDYAGYNIDSRSKIILDSLNINYIKKKRIENAKFLMDELKDCKNILLMFNSLSSKDCPLFLPILIKSDIRDALHKYLIKNKVYCPIHWPLAQVHHGIEGECKRIYYSELSLLCDQRYELKEIKHEVNLIKKFMAEID